MTTTTAGVVVVQTSSLINATRVKNNYVPKILQFGIDSKEVKAFAASTDKNATRRSKIGSV